jgi:hypothetical protein
MFHHNKGSNDSVDVSKLTTLVSKSNKTTSCGNVTPIPTTATVDSDDENSGWSTKIPSKYSNQQKSTPTNHYDSYDTSSGNYRIHQSGVSTGDTQSLLNTQDSYKPILLKTNISKTSSTTTNTNTSSSTATPNNDEYYNNFNTTNKHKYWETSYYFEKTCNPDLLQDINW